MSVLASRRLRQLRVKGRGDELEKGSQGGQARRTSVAVTGPRLLATLTSPHRWNHINPQHAGVRGAEVWRRGKGVASEMNG